MSDRVLGIDVSKWQGDKFDWDKAKEAGAKFAFIRAGSIDSVTGECYEDYQFQRNSEIAPSYMPVGFYWYFRPNFNPIEQAIYFTNLVHDKNIQLPMVGDLEVRGGMGKWAIANSFEKFVKTVAEAYPAMIYLRGWWWNEFVDTGYPTWSDYDLWIARYNSYLSGPWSDSGKFRPEPWTDWKFWQYSETGDGPTYGTDPYQSKSIDLNYFNGNEAEFEAYLTDDSVPAPTPEPEPEPIPVPEPTPDLVRVTANVLNVRTDPVIIYDTLIGHTENGDIWEVLDEVDFDGRTWYKVPVFIAKEFTERV